MFEGRDLVYLIVIIYDRSYTVSIMNNDDTTAEDVRQYDLGQYA